MNELAPVHDVSIVIPAHNAADTLEAQLDAIKASDAAWISEVVVVDSFSTDSTASLVREYSTKWPKVRTVKADRPGANAARNTGVAATTADAVLLCDADDVVASSWSASLFRSLQDHDLVCGRYSLEELNDSATRAARGEVASTSPPPTGQLFGGIGGNCGFRRSAWNSLGGLREYHYGCDDAEFFWRGHLSGLAVGYEDDAVVHYRLRPGMRSLYRQQVTWSSGRALLFKEFGASGLMTRRSPAAALKAWAWLVVHLPDARSDDPTARGRWVRGLADAVGRVRGSIRHRVLFL